MKKFPVALRIAGEMLSAMVGDEHMRRIVAGLASRMP